MNPVNPAIHICLIHAPNHVHADALLDPALYFYHQFKRLGASVSFERNQLRADAVNFVFGAHNGFDPANLKKFSCIIVNLEQVGIGGASLRSAYLHLLKAAVTVDYDPANPPAYTNRPEDVPIVSFGYASYLNPGSDQALPLHERPIDILFIGSMNERRFEFLNRIESAGKTVSLLQTPVYGATRDTILRQAKMLLNVHFYESARFEQVRAFVSLSNGTPILSERHPHSDPGAAYDPCVTWMDDAVMDDFLRHDFGTPLFYEVMEQQLALFRQMDPLVEYADLLGFAYGVWKAHESMLPAVRQDEYIGLLYPRQLLPGQTSAMQREMSVSGDLIPAAPRFQMLPDTEERIENMLEADRPDQAMIMMANAVSGHHHQPGIINHALFYPAFDRYLRKLSTLLSEQKGASRGSVALAGEHGAGVCVMPVAKQDAGGQEKTPSESMCNGPDGLQSIAPVKGGHLIIATELYQVGGHSRLLELLVDSVDRPVLVLTDLFGSYRNAPESADWIRARMPSVPIYIITETDQWKKAQNLANIVDQCKPAHVWYVQHQQDTVAWVGTLFSSGVKKHLLHHADHNPSLGCTFEDVTMVDLTEAAQAVSSASLGRKAYRLPLHVAERGQRPAGEPVSLDKMSVVMAGRRGKFSLGGPVGLHLIVETALRTVGGSFFHIGDLGEHCVRLVKNHLKTQGINPKRFMPVGQVPSVWETLKTLDAHVYIGSAPFSGGTSAVEAQGCGYPVLPYTGFEAGSLLADYSSYADVALGWKDLSELREKLVSMPEQWEARCREARAFYEANFSKAVFEAAIQEVCDG
ncbi:MAG: hypothetical protein Q4D91_01620 [Lautropia sp.]|nr:hypothetical protein [Lautropia sp.]